MPLAQPIRRKRHTIEICRNKRIYASATVPQQESPAPYALTTTPKQVCHVSRSSSARIPSSPCISRNSLASILYQSQLLIRQLQLPSRHQLQLPTKYQL